MRVMSTKFQLVAISALSILLIASVEAGTPSSDSSTAPPTAPYSISQAPPVAQKGKTTGEIQSPSPQSSILDIIEKLFRIAAYIIGALWVYFNFWKGRTYRPRIEPMVTGQILNHQGSKLIKIVINLKNVGLSKVDVEQKGTALRLLSYDSSNTNDPWKHQSTISILSAHKWIEPGETVGEQFLIPFTETNLIAVKAEVILVSKKTMWESAIILP
ncbi:MAG: hypothetical protein KKH04_17880 [Proteobacteria bacterium]|nr:hypothetical protein [Pseudomonadota bacterium]